MTEQTDFLLSEQAPDTTDSADTHHTHHHHHTQPNHQDNRGELLLGPSESTSLLSPTKITEKTAYNVSVSSRTCLALCSTLPFIIAISVILAQSDDDCDKPIRTWLFVTLATITFSLGFYLLFNIIVLNCLNSQSVGLTIVIQGLNGLLGIFFIAWVIVGTVWLFDDSSCQDDFKDGYNMTLAILIISYVSYASIILMLCCLCCCSAAGLGVLALSKQHETI